MKTGFKEFFLSGFFVCTAAWGVRPYVNAQIEDPAFTNPEITKKLSIRFDNLEDLEKYDLLRQTIDVTAKQTVEYVKAFSWYGKGELEIEVDQIQTDYHITLTNEILSKISQELTLITAHGSYIDGNLAGILKKSFQDFAPHKDIPKAVMDNLNTQLRLNKNFVLAYYFGH